MQQAIKQIGLAVGKVVRTSRFIETEPWGFVSEHRFLNACICVETLLSPRQVLEATQRIERQLGRERKSENGVYHDRPIDIDLLMLGDEVSDERARPRYTAPPYAGARLCDDTASRNSSYASSLGKRTPHCWRSVSIRRIMRKVSAWGIYEGSIQ